MFKPHKSSFYAEKHSLSLENKAKYARTICHYCVIKDEIKLNGLAVYKVNGLW